MNATRLIAWLGSAVGNVSLFGAIMVGWPVLPPWNTVFSHPELDTIQLGFRPYVDTVFPANPLLRPGVDCPHPLKGAGPVALDHAPLPFAFDPFAYRDPLFACVRVDGAGAISGVELIGVEDAATAAALKRAIRNDWRFSPISIDHVDTGWVRIRLNATRPPGVDYFYPL